MEAIPPKLDGPGPGRRAGAPDEKDRAWPDPRATLSPRAVADVDGDYPAPPPGGDLALEVGRNAHEYLEECFYTEVSILDREKFDAVPEIVKSDLTITRHLGKGNFSDVFEVFCKGGRLANAEPQRAGRRPSRGRRATLWSSVAPAALSRPSARGGSRPAFALKCLRPQIRSNADQFTIGSEDLVHETAVLANLSHRHIIRLHGRASGHLRDAFVLNDGYFILLDKLNETLPDRIGRWKDNPRFTLRGPTEEQIDVARSIADAMCYLHSKKVIFRDLKPANVGFDSAGTLKLFDFGFAIGLPERDEIANPFGFLFDRCGTPRYMAPEVGLSLGYALPADVYSLGILIWEICALAKPFASIRTSAEFERHVFMGGERPLLENRWPAAVRRIMESCWRAAPGKRATMPDVRSALSSAMAGGDDERKAPARAVRPGTARRISLDGW